MKFNGRSAACVLAGLIYLAEAASVDAQQVESAQLAALQQAKECVANVARFGRIGGTVYQPSATIQMANDGGWCWAQIRFTWQGGAITPSLKLLQPQQHCQLMFGSVEQRVRLAYHPNPGFVGSDTFTVSAPLPDQAWDVPVAVTVTH